MAVEELILGEWVIRLDGNIVELLHKTGLSYRYHVMHVAVEGKPKEDGLSLRVGIDGGGAIIEGGTVPVPAERQAEVEALLAEALKRREKLA